jgi:hypothetical protein
MGMLLSSNEIQATKEENSLAGMSDVPTVDITDGFSKARSQTRHVHHHKLKTIVEEPQPYLPVNERTNHSRRIVVSTSTERSSD